MSFLKFGPYYHGSRHERKAVLDLDDDTCMTLADLFSSNQNNEATVTLPYHANMDSCRSDFNVNIALLITQSGEINAGILSLDLRVMTSADVRLDEGTWDMAGRNNEYSPGCVVHHTSIVGASVKQWYKCTCERPCLVILIISKLYLADASIQLCGLNINW